MAEPHAAVGFDRDTFVERCREARRSASPVDAVVDLLAAVVARPATIDEALGLRVGADFGILHAGDDLVIQRAIFPVGYRTGIHEHRMWTVSAVYAGTERHELYRVVGDRLEPAGTDEVRAGGVRTLAPDVAHDSQSVGPEPLRVLHVYLGNLFASGAGEWDTPTSERRAFSDDWLQRLLEALRSEQLLDA